MGNRVKESEPGPQRVPVPAALRMALVSGLLTLLLAPWLGMAWQWLAPAPKYLNIEGAVFPFDEDSSEFIAADGWFLLLGLLLGIACGAVGYWRYRRALPAMLAITAAAFAGAWIARRTGQEFGPPELVQAAVGTVDGETVNGAVDVRSKIVLLGWPIGVLIAYVSMILGLEKPQPRTGDAAQHTAFDADGDPDDPDDPDSEPVDRAGSSLVPRSSRSLS